MNGVGYEKQIVSLRTKLIGFDKHDNLGCVYFGRWMMQIEVLIQTFKNDPCEKSC